jgi:hypothetical protein
MLLLQLLLPLLQVPGASTLSCESQDLNNFELTACRCTKPCLQGPCKRKHKLVKARPQQKIQLLPRINTKHWKANILYINEAQRVVQLIVEEVAATLNHLLRCRTLVSVAHLSSRRSPPCCSHVSSQLTATFDVLHRVVETPLHTLL